MAATEPLLVAQGRNVSTRQIATAAGIAEGTIFGVFDSKESLIDAVLDEAFDVKVTCRRLADIDPDGDLAPRLVQAVRLVQERLQRVFALFHALALTQQRRPDPETHAKHTQDDQLLELALVAVIIPDAAELRFSPHEAARLLKSLTFALSHPLLSDANHAGPEHIVDILLHGIAVESACACSPRKDVAPC